MHLKRLEMQGFKSFPDKIEIRFEDGITAIVGPNGSGKSNVADAIRWVLGEQSAKQLRGAKMEDVIFNGTQKRRAQSYCEVSLVFDNEDHHLGLDYAEIAVTRRMYRDGKSEYFINKSACRLRDIIDLFRDTGIGKEGYSIIGQGRIDEILSNKAEDRRAVFEEASGVAKFKADRADALRSLGRTEDNLIRIDDILEELRSQIEPLQEQSEVAKRYLLLRDDLRYQEINLFLVQAVRNQERIAQQEALAQDLAVELENTEVARGELAEEEDSVFSLMRTQEAHAVQLRESVVESTAKEQSCEGEIKVLQERIASGERENARIQSDEEAKLIRIEQINQQLQALQTSCDDTTQSTQQRKDELDALQVTFDASAAELAAQEQALEDAKGEVIRRLNRMSDIKSRRSQLEAMRQGLMERQSACDGELSRAQEFAQSVTDELEEERGHAQTVRNLLTTAEVDRNTYLSNLADLSKEETGIMERIGRMRDEMGQSRTRLKLMEQMKRDYEGFHSAVRNLLRDASRESHLGACVCGVVAEIMSVPQKYEKAIEVALGTALQNIITPDEASAKRLIEHLRAHQYGRATFLPLSGIQSRSLNGKEVASAKGRGCFGAASDLVSYDAKYRPAIENLLGRVVIVEDLDAGIRLARENRYSFRIVTLAGDVLNSGGSMTGGSMQSRSTSILSRDRQIEDEQAKLAKMQRESEELTAEAEQIKTEAQRISQRLHDVEEQIANLRVELGQHQERANILEQNAADRQNDVERVEMEQSALAESLQDIADELSAIDSSSENGDGTAASDEDISRMQQTLYEKRTAHEALRETIQALRLALSSDEARQESLQQRARMLQDELLRIEKEQEHAQEIAASVAESAKSDAELLAQKKEELKALQENLAAMRRQLKEADEARRATNEQSAALAKKRTALQEQSDSLTERIHRSQISKTRMEAELEALHERIWNDYELTFASAQPLADEAFQVNGAVTRISKLRSDIKELGDVNVSSIEQYESVSTRVASLSAEREDLTQAKANLEEVIAKFEEEIKERFKTQFELINENFKVVFTQLFNGGTAELRLTDPDDLMETGVDIVAQPPGKKQQALSLLSGGERTLTAIAVLFAMLNIKPTPFCVLDEVEAALDEANTGMYADFLKDYSRKTQFVIITHRKESMEVSDAMYGIAMQERGISSLVSVKLTDANA